MLRFRSDDILSKKKSEYRNRLVFCHLDHNQLLFYNTYVFTTIHAFALKLRTKERDFRNHLGFLSFKL
ncbi:unnamed protein product [Adineta ricciae]|uniref:Uncharacterized protein n=1 Tax=Adineta ricciae TaxID=249248 RepID=A0A813Y9U5_ADIRI|nr:unnamed protein product [Adineta ricciae]